MWFGGWWFGHWCWACCLSPVRWERDIRLRRGGREEGLIPPFNAPHASLHPLFHLHTQLVTPHSSILMETSLTEGVHNGNLTTGLPLENNSVYLGFQLYYNFATHKRTRFGWRYLNVFFKTSITVITVRLCLHTVDIRGAPSWVYHGCSNSEGGENLSSKQGNCESNCILRNSSWLVWD